MIGEPLIDECHKLVSVRAIESLRVKTLAEPAKDFKELGVGLTVGVGHWAPISLHTLLLEAEMGLGESVKRLQHDRIHSFALALVQRGAKILGHLKDHLMLSVDAVDSRGVAY